MKPMTDYEIPGGDALLSDRLLRLPDLEEGFVHMKFPVVLHKDADSEYGVTVPDVPGCFSAGSTVSQAFENVKEALSLHYEGLIADGEPLPQIHDIDDHLDDPQYAGGSGAWLSSMSRPISENQCGSTPRCPSNCLSASIKPCDGTSVTARVRVSWPRRPCANFPPDRGVCEMLASASSRPNREPFR